VFQEFKAEIDAVPLSRTAAEMAAGEQTRRHTRISGGDEV
jgi:hypothetical protein